MTNPTTQEGEDFEAIVGLPKPTPEEHQTTSVKGVYPYDVPNPNAAHGKSHTEPHGHTPHRVDGVYPYDTPNPTAQAKDRDNAAEGVYPHDDEVD
jgi:hypothetical protein